MAILIKAPEPDDCIVVPNRIALIDADVVAYYSSFGLDEYPATAAETKCWQRCQQIEQETQAKYFRYYLTGSYENNFRTSLARLKRYKGDRYDENSNRLKDQPKWLQHVRQWLITNKAAQTAEFQEADDAISIAAATIRADGNYESCISTVDKDLGINPGWFHNQMHNTVEMITPFGELCLIKKFKKDETKSSHASLKGNGMKFFYAQLLMGDPTDWIPGLPKVSDYQYQEFGCRRGGCGPKAAFLTLETAEDDQECLRRVMTSYKSYWEGKTWADWREPDKLLEADWKEMLIEQGRLLWMRRKEGEMWQLA